MLTGRAELRPRKQCRAQWHDQGELLLVQPWAAAALAMCLNAIYDLPRHSEQAGDQLVEVDGVDIRELAPEQVGKMIMGEEVRLPAQFQSMQEACRIWKGPIAACDRRF